MAVRSQSPTTALWARRHTASEKRAIMLNMGLHIFDPAWQGAAPKGRIFSTSWKDCTMKVYGTDESLSFPIQCCTKVWDVREALANALLVPADDLVFLVKQGNFVKKMNDLDEMATKVTVRGITSFKPQPHKWKHPRCVIGAGYHGLKTMMAYIKSGDTNVVGFDKNNRVGGYCWITAANKTSKLQTEFGAFHVWWGQDFVTDKCGYPSDWLTFPHKKDVLEHFQYAAESYGILPYYHLNSNVVKVGLPQDKNNLDSAYALTVHSTAGSEKSEEVQTSMIYSFPGSLTQNRVITYPGEDVFGGHIGYGMNDDIGYEHLPGNNSAILGNGAFAVENVRTCCEYGANHIYLLTRRKNLASPRIPCWFIHQGPMPTPGGMLLKMFEPMYELAGFGSPWDFWSVHASKDHKNVSVIQNSRFGIGDVTFLAVKYGKCEYIVDTLKRCTKHTLHLTDSGRKLTGVTNIIKSLGLVGDYTFDRLMSMKARVGPFCDGDWRRLVLLDDTGMNAANFTTFSTGISTTGFVRTFKFLHDFPKEMQKVIGMGLLQQLPSHKAEDQYDKPAYVTDVKFAQSSAIILESMCPKLSSLSASDPEYKHRMYHTAHPFDKFLQECIDSWDEYQRTWKENGATHEYVPYPYTKEMVKGYFKEYKDRLGIDISIDGPTKDSETTQPSEQSIADLPHWATDEAAVKQAEEMRAASNGEWWNTVGPQLDIGKQKGKKVAHAAHA